MNPILEPLTFPDTKADSEERTNVSESCQCLMCEHIFGADLNDDQILAHFLINHKLVIADVKKIVDLKRYVNYWRGRFSGTDPKEFCFSMTTINEKGDEEEYLMLADDLPEDKNLRGKLKDERLTLVLKQQQKERYDESFSHSCLFCRKVFTGNRKMLFEHMNFDHNFSVGLPDNVVFVEEFLKVLDGKLSLNLCLYCEKTFKDRNVLKEHMRKKQHKKINPLNHTYDKFYVINYSDPGKGWKEIMAEFEEAGRDEDWSDWCEPAAEAVCLFCQYKSSELDDISVHHKLVHSFDLNHLQECYSFYQQIKVINYVRRQVHEKKCIYCDQGCESDEELKRHMEASKHFLLPDKSVWDQAQFYFPTYENDALLCQLEADGAVDETDQVAVIPEDIIEAGAESIEELRHSLTELAL